MVITLFVLGEVGALMFKKQSLGKRSVSISRITALIRGRQTSTASLKSFSSLSSFFLREANESHKEQ